MTQITLTDAYFAYWDRGLEDLVNLESLIARGLNVTDEGMVDTQQLETLLGISRASIPDAKRDTTEIVSMSNQLQHYDNYASILTQNTQGKNGNHGVQGERIEIEPKRHAAIQTRKPSVDVWEYCDQNKGRILTPAECDEALALLKQIDQGDKKVRGSMLAELIVYSLNTLTKESSDSDLCDSIPLYIRTAKRLYKEACAIDVQLSVKSEILACIASAYYHLAITHPVSTKRREEKNTYLAHALSYRQQEIEKLEFGFMEMKEDKSYLRMAHAHRHSGYIQLEQRCKDDAMNSFNKSLDCFTEAGKTGYKHAKNMIEQTISELKKRGINLTRPLLAPVSK